MSNPASHPRRRKIFILIPAPTPDGPIKGAYALANSLCMDHDVTLVGLKGGPGAYTALSDKVRFVSLADIPYGFPGKLLAYRRLLQLNAEKDLPVSLSMCFSADLVNRLGHGRATAIASVRGNLFENYRFDYGPLGTCLAWFHMHLIKGMHRVIGMSHAMQMQLRQYVPASRISVIGNFIDEEAVDQHRNKDESIDRLRRFVFLGTVSERKCPLLVIRAIHVLRKEGLDVALDVIGNGPLLDAARLEASRLAVSDHVTFHGSLRNPLPVVASACALVLPSLSEGVPRAALEALHLGVPCVLRNVDGNNELITEGSNGFLFAQDEALAAAMRNVIELARAQPIPRPSLLPAAFRQAQIARHYINLVETVDAR
jgi:glycosyltransferase involved in cell wall biosynthesis